MRTTTNVQSGFMFVPYVRRARSWDDAGFVVGHIERPTEN
jgi:hypothetical protein